MTISTFDDLVATITDWLDDDTLAEEAPTFIQLAEARFNRKLFNLDNELVATTPTAADDRTVALPLRFKEMRSIRVDATRTAVLTQLSLDDLDAAWSNATSAAPENYAIVGSELILGPTPDAIYSLQMAYAEGFQALSASNQTNWLLTANPDLYLFSALIFAEARGWNDERLGTLKIGADEMLGEVIRADARRRRGSQTADVPATYF